MLEQVTSHISPQALAGGVAVAVALVGGKLAWWAGKKAIRAMSPAVLAGALAVGGAGLFGYSEPGPEATAAERLHGAGKGLGFAAMLSGICVGVIRGVRWCCER